MSDPPNKGETMRALLERVDRLEAENARLTTQLECEHEQVQQFKAMLDAEHELGLQQRAEAAVMREALVKAATADDGQCRFCGAEPGMIHHVRLCPIADALATNLARRAKAVADFVELARVECCLHDLTGLAKTGVSSCKCDLCIGVAALDAATDNPLYAGDGQGNPLDADQAT